MVASRRRDEGLGGIAAEPEEFVDARMGSEGDLAQEHRLATRRADEDIGVLSLTSLGPAQ